MRSRVIFRPPESARSRSDATRRQARRQQGTEGIEWARRDSNPGASPRTPANAVQSDLSDMQSSVSDHYALLERGPVLRDKHVIESEVGVVIPPTIVDSLLWRRLVVSHSAVSRMILSASSPEIRNTSGRS
jgi:hypothetical protein